MTDAARTRTPQSRAFGIRWRLLTPSEFGSWIVAQGKESYPLSDFDPLGRLVGMQRHNDSHLDHALTIAQVDYLLERFADRDAFFIETIELPENLGTVPCALYGPTMGDVPIELGTLYITYERRGDRSYASRLISLPPRPTRMVTVIAGPHEGIPCVLFTAFGGPLAPREPGDPTLHAMAEPEKTAELEKSEAFWAVHALSRE